MNPVWRPPRRARNGPAVPVRFRPRPSAELIEHPAWCRTAVAVVLVLALTLGASRTAWQSDRAGPGAGVPAGAAAGTVYDAGIGTVTIARPVPTPSGERRAALAGQASAPAGSPTRTDVLTARYHRLAALRGLMLARVSLRNRGDASQNWRVVLHFGAGVRTIRSAWASGTAVSVTRSGQAFVVAGTRPLAAGGRGEVWVTFTTVDRRTTGPLPDRCTVNGRACEIA